MTRPITLAVLGSAWILLAAPLAGQQADAAEPERLHNTRGLLVGIAFNGTSISARDSDEVESGGGINLRVGYGFNDRWSVSLQATAASIAIAGYTSHSYLLTHGDLGVRYLFTRGSRTFPYLEAALSGRQIAFSIGGPFGDLQARGAAVAFGGGAEIFLNRTLAVDLGLGLATGDFTEGRLGRGNWESLDDGSFGANSVRVNVGLVWHP